MREVIDDHFLTDIKMRAGSHSQISCERASNQCYGTDQ